jgi:hypothetical protein
MKPLKKQNRNQYFKLNVFSILTLLSCLITPYCFSQNQQTISVSEHIKVTANTFIGGYHIKCKGLGSGIVAANPTFGVGPYTYSWSNGATGESNGDLFAGIYTITITDANQEAHTDTFEIIEPDSLDYQVDLSRYSTFNIDRINGTTGIIAISPNGGTPPYKIYWNDNGGNEFKRKNLTAGTYSFLITDANECTKSGIINLNQPTDLTVTFTNIVGPSCYEKEDGKATINISGGTGEYYAIWDNGSSELNQTKLKGGHHAVRIFELDKLVLETGVTLPDPQELQLELVTSQYNGYNISCADCFNGSITSNVTGGTTPYAYQWSEASQSTTPNLINLTSGQYTLNVTDANGCETKSSVLLTMPSSKDWSRQGNANIDPNEFIGSTDGSDVVFKSNNQEALRLSSEQINIYSRLQFSSNALNLSTSSQQYVNPCNFQLPAFTSTGQLTTLQNINNAIHQNITSNIAAGLPDTVICPDSTQFGQTWSLLGNDLNYFGFTPKLGTTSNHDLRIVTNNTQRMVVKKGTGNVGIGVANPTEKLEVNGSGLFSGKLGIGSASPTAALHITDGALNSIIIENTQSPNKFQIEAASGASRVLSTGSILLFLNSDQDADNSSNFVITKNASSYNPTSTSQELFKIKNDGTGYIKDLWVKAPGTNGVFPDYVFAKDYKLRSLAEVKAYYQKHQHLPDMPSAKEIEAQGGVSMSDMLIKLTKIAEENTIYLTQQDEQIKLLQAENMKLKKLIEKLAKQ